MWQIIVGTEFAAFVDPVEASSSPEDAFPTADLILKIEAYLCSVDLAELDFFSPEVHGVRSVCIRLQDESPGVLPSPVTCVRCPRFTRMIGDGHHDLVDMGVQLRCAAELPGSCNETPYAIYKQGYEMVETLLTQDPRGIDPCIATGNKGFSNKRGIEGMRDDIQGSLPIAY